MNISVVIPAFNEEKYIKNCLQAITSQEVKADEIIIVDNNCTDATIKIAREFPVKIIQERKRGIIYARNRGYNCAQSDLIVRLDADAIPDKNWLKKIKSYFESGEHIDALVGPLVMYDLPLRTPFYSKAFYAFCKLMLGHNLLIGPNTALKKEMWNKVKNKVCENDSLVHEDIDLAIHINKAGGKICYDSKLINYVSGRRIRYNPYSFFVQYPIKLIKSVVSHRKKWHS